MIGMFWVLFSPKLGSGTSTLEYYALVRLLPHSDQSFAEIIFSKKDNFSLKILKCTQRIRPDQLRQSRWHYRYATLRYFL